MESLWASANQSAINQTYQPLITLTQQNLLLLLSSSLSSSPFRPHCGPEVDSASSRIECQEYFLGVQGGPCVTLTYCHLHVQTVVNPGSLTSWNPQALSRPVQGLLFIDKHTRNLIHNLVVMNLSKALCIKIMRYQF